MVMYLGSVSFTLQTPSDWTSSPYRRKCWSGGVGGLLIEVPMEGPAWVLPMERVYIRLKDS